MTNLKILVDNVKAELFDKEFEIEELDNKIKEIFKTRDTIWDNVKEWVINNSENDTTICSCYHIKNENVLYVTFKICKNKYDKLLKYAVVKIVDIEAK